MPTYKLPPEKKDDDSDALVPMDYERRITVPINDAIMEKLEIGMDAEVMMKGSIIELKKLEDEEHAKMCLTLKLKEVSCYGGGQEAFERGYKRGPKR